MDKFVDSTDPDDNREEARLIEFEIHAYLNCEVGSAKTEIDNPLQFWKSEHMYILALWCLPEATCASCVSVESMFSTCVILLNLKCSSMSPYRANVVLFIRDNYHQFPP